METRYSCAVRAPRILGRVLENRLPRAWPRRTRRGRILAIKWGLNPNSSSLGVDVTFLLFGAAALSLATPFMAALMRLRKPAADPHLSAHEEPDVPATPE